MQLNQYFLFLVFLFFGIVSCGKVKFFAFKGPHFGYAGLKVKGAKLLPFKLDHGLGHGGFGAGGFHSSGYEHHEYHESHHSGGSFGGGGGGWLGK